MIDSKPTNMGLTKEQINTIFVRKFRWTVESELGIPTPFLTKFDVDWTRREIHLAAYETVNEHDNDVPILKWLDEIVSGKPEELYFRTFDGCGNMLYSVVFDGITLLEQRSSFDYSISDVSTQHVKLSYQSAKRFFKGPEKKTYWQIVIEDVATKISLKEPPSVTIEDVPHSYLNTTDYLMGSPISKPLELYFNEEAPLLVTKPTNVKLQSFENGVMTQCWLLNDFWFREYDASKSSAKASYSRMVPTIVSHDN